MVVRGGLDARVVWTKPSYGGLVGAALGYFAALTPSLLPRALPFMIVVTAIGVVAGYAAGSAIEWFARTIARLDAWYPNKKVTTVSLVVTWGLALVFTPIAVAWQNTCSVVGCQQKCRSGWGLRVHSWDQHRPLLLSLRAGFARCRDRE